MSQRLDLLESSHLLPFTYVRQFQDLNNRITYPTKKFLLPRTAAVLLLNGQLNLPSLVTVNTAHAPLQRLNGVIADLSVEAQEFMANNEQFVNFYDGITCFQIIDPRIIVEIQRLAAV